MLVGSNTTPEQNPDRTHRVGEIKSHYVTHHIATSDTAVSTDVRPGIGPGPQKGKTKHFSLLYRAQMSCMRRI